MEHKQGKKPEKKQALWIKIAINLLLMAGMAVALVWLGTLWLDTWTSHGEYATVPEVKGMPYDMALQTLESQGFEVELSDSVYDNSSRPGTVIDQNPKVGTKVKEGRLIYLTVNAFSTRSVTIPGLTDTSLRQAQSILSGLGIKNITVEEVPSEFKNLVIAVKRDGRRLSAGARVPVTAHIVIEVGAGLPENEDTDSVIAPDTLTMEHLDLL